MNGVETRTPVQIVVVRRTTDTRTDVYVDTLRLAFEGSSDSAGSPSAYLAEAVDLGIRVLEPAGHATVAEAEKLVSGARDTIFVVIGGWPDDSGTIRRVADDHQVVMVPAPPARRTGAVQGPGPADGVESAFAPVVAALRAMERTRYVLTSRMGGGQSAMASGGAMRLFISHAKVDGIAVAKSLIGLLNHLKAAGGNDVGFTYFYDAEHIPAGTVWRSVIRENAGRSMLIALRTEAYDGRYWCRREFLAAEARGLPILVVDLRKDQYHDSALLPFDVAPSVRVQDGNLIRVVLRAMAAHLRALRVQSIAPAVTVLPHRPSVFSLSGAVRASATRKIAYPAPKLPKGYEQAVAPLLHRGTASVQLVTFDEL